MEVSQWLKQLWGTTSGSGDAEQSLAMNNDGVSTKSIAFKSRTLSGKTSMYRIFSVGCAVLICALLLLAISFSSGDQSSADAAKSLEELRAMNKCEGSWARSYRNAQGQSKQGLELLFRCHIIPAEEFAHSQVSQEHIDECIWIAAHMLRQRKLEEWTKMCSQAQTDFEDSIKVCFGAGSSAALQLYHSPRGEQTNSGKQPPSDPIADKSLEQGTSPPPTPILKTPTDHNKSLLARCRQITAASDAQKTQWDAAPTPTASP